MPTDSCITVFSTQCNLSLRSLGIRDCGCLVHCRHNHLCTLLEELVQYLGRRELLGYCWRLDGIHLRSYDRGFMDYSPHQHSVHQESLCSLLSFSIFSQPSRVERQSQRVRQFGWRGFGDNLRGTCL